MFAKVTPPTVDRDVLACSVSIPRHWVMEITRSLIIALSGLEIDLIYLSAFRLWRISSRSPIICFTFLLYRLLVLPLLPSMPQHDYTQFIKL